MPTVQIDLKDFENLLGRKLPTDIDELNDLLSYVKGEIKLIEGSEAHIEIKDSNRPDIWNIEGLARALKGFLGIEEGLKTYSVYGDSGVTVSVDSRLEHIRPYIGCAVVRGVKLNDFIIRGAMHLQDKLDQTYGRRRRRTSIGLYDFGLIKPPLRYTVAKPREISFVPLGFEEELTLEEILEKHPKGIEYGGIVKEYEVWPILLDSEERVLSFPPIINSNDLGRITERTRDVLVEVTGTRKETVLNTLNIVVLSFADRGGRIESSEVIYSYKNEERVTTPKLETGTVTLTLPYIKEVLGIELSRREVSALLKKARFRVASAKGDTLTVEVPCYRIDIMHPVDVVEEIAIAYGYDNIEPERTMASTIGGVTPEREFRDLIREIMIGLGFQEVLTYTLTNPDNLFTKMNIKPTPIIEILNPKIQYLTCLRNWLLPGLLEFLGANTHVEYPQRIFEVGYAIIPDKNAETKSVDTEKLSCVIIHSNANFTEARSNLDALLRNLGLSCVVKETEHGSFIEGRVGRVLVAGKDVGLIGEIHPLVLENWRLENPAAAFELDLNRLFQLKQIRV